MDKPDFRTNVANEVELFGSLKDNLWNSVQDRVANHKSEILVETATAVVVGAGLAALTKNPELLGQAVAPLVKEAIPFATKVGLGLAAADWGVKLGAPAYEVWNAPSNLASNKLKLSENVGSGLVDYTAMGAGGIAGGFTAFKFTPELMPKAPGLDLKPSLKLNEVPRVLDHPESFTTNRANSLEPDVVALYEASFPKAERQPVDEVADLVSKGRILVHATRDSEGKLGAFSFTSMHDEGATKFAGLDFVATNEANRSQGIGSLHLQRVADSIKTERPDLVAMTLEMEHPNEPGISADELATRIRRSKFYDRLDAPNTNIKYNIIDFEDPAYRGMAQHRAFVFKPEEFNAVKAAHTFMTDEGGYQLGKFDPAVREFNQMNGYWQPNSDGRVGAASAAYLNVLKQLSI